MLVSRDHVEEFRSRGFTILRDAIDGPTLERLREECAYFVGYVDAQMDARGVATRGITHRGKRYFISSRYRDSRFMPQFLFGERMADIVRPFLGDEVFLFHEQWVVKGPEQGMKFAWHQDSGYVEFLDPGNSHAPYLTCWCALDDMSEKNGTIFVLPHERAGTRDRVLPHEQEAGTNDLVGYRGDDPGELIEVSAGSIAVFSSTSLHRSSANRTDAWRRAYLAQYSREPIRSTKGGLWSQAVPFLRDGECVYDPSTDTAERWSTPRRPRPSRP